MRTVSVLFSFGLCVVVILVGACRKETEDEPTASSDLQQKEREGKRDSTVRRPLLKVHWIDVYANYVVTINGFPARERWVKGRAVDNSFDVPLQTGLVRGENEVEMRLRPRLRHHGQELRISGVEFTVEVFPYRDAPEAVGVMKKAQVDSAYAQWAMRTRKEWKRVLAKRSPEAAIDSIKIWAGTHPLTVTTTFDNEAGPDFSKIFEEAPVLEDTPATRERLKDYAMRLRDLIADRDGAGLYREIRYAQNASYRQKEEPLPPDSTRRVKWVEAAQEETGWFRKAGEKTDFSREQVGLRPWVEGRVWELYRGSGEPLFGGWKIYVGEVDGEISVVRLE